MTDQLVSVPLVGLFGMWKRFVFGCTPKIESDNSWTLNGHLNSCVKCCDMFNPCLALNGLFFWDQFKDNDRDLFFLWCPNAVVFFQLLTKNHLHAHTHACKHTLEIQTTLFYLLCFACSACAKKCCLHKTPLGPVPAFGRHESYLCQLKRYSRAEVQLSLHKKPRILVCFSFWKRSNGARGVHVIRSISDI